MEFANKHRNLFDKRSIVQHSCACRSIYTISIDALIKVSHSLAASATDVEAQHTGRTDVMLLLLLLLHTAQSCWHRTHKQREASDVR